MHSAKNQVGLTIISIILILIPIGFIAYIVIRAVPAYYEDFKVGSVVNSLKKEHDLKDKSGDEIYTMIKKRLDINDISSVEKNDIKVQKTPTEVSVTIDYEAKVPLVGNAALALSFHRSAVVR